MFAAYVGKMGSGKTCMMTYVMYKDYKERRRKIQANYNLKFAHEKLDLRRMLDAGDQQIKNSSLGIDEAWLFFDARSSQKKRNQLISHVLLQSRKRDVDIYVTSQSFKQLDTRFRQNCDYVILMAMRNDVMLPRIFNRDTGRWTKLAINAKPIFSLYDTDQLIDPTSMDDDTDDIPINDEAGTFQTLDERILEGDEYEPATEMRHIEGEILDILQKERDDKETDPERRQHLDRQILRILNGESAEA